MIGFRKQEHPGAIVLKGNVELADDSFELARFWVSPKDGRSHVLVGFPTKWRPELLGSLLVESIHTAAQAYAATTDIAEDEALDMIWRGLDEERTRLAPQPAEETE